MINDSIGERKWRLICANVYTSVYYF